MIQIRAIPQQGGAPVDLVVDNNTSIQLTKSVSDIENFADRNGGFTFNFDLPFCTENNNFFEHYYEVSQSIGTGVFGLFTFNPYLRTKVEIYGDGINVLRGYLQLNDVATQGRVYSVTCFDTVGLLREELGDKKLVDLDLSYYDHVFNFDNIEKSTEAAGVELSNNSNRSNRIKYPFCDYGAGYTVQQITDSSAGVLDVDFRPWYAIEMLFKEILKQAGFTRIESDFLSGDKFTKVFMLGACEAFGIRTDILQYRFLTRLGANAFDTIDFANSQTPQVDYFINLFFDPPIPVVGTDQFETPNGIIDDFLGTNTITLTLSGVYGFQFNHRVFALQSEQYITYGTTNQIGFFEIGGAGRFFPVAQFTGGQTTLTSDTHSGSPNIYLPAGTYKWGYRFDRVYDLNLLQFTGPKFSLDQEISFLEMTTSPQQAASGIVQAKNNLPDFTQIDFFRGIVQHFNLFIDDRDGVLLIEPYPDYMAKGETQDWTQKLDLSKDVIIQPTYNFRKKRFGLKYTDDKDYYTNYRVEKAGETASLGSKFIDDTSEFSEGEDVVTLPFGAPPFYQTRDTGKSGGILPTYILQFREDGGISQGDYLPRLAFIQSRSTNVLLPAPSSEYQIYVLDTLNGNTSVLDYDYADIIDSDTLEDLTFNQSIQKNWGAKANIPRTFEVGGALETEPATADSFTLYYEQYIREIYGINAKLVTAYFDLTPLDFASIKFNSLIFVKDTYFRLNKISGYTPAESKSTKVELIKLDPFGQLKRNCDYILVGYKSDGTMLWRQIGDNTQTELTTRGCCTNQGGLFVEGDDGLGKCYTQESGVPDPPPGEVKEPPGQEVLTGACCYTTEEGSQCAIVTPDTCEFLGGDFKGLGTDCTECDGE